MTQDSFPITPPPELVEQWWNNTHGAFYEFEAVATQAARWGADQELEACCSQLAYWGVHGYNKLYEARRPKPPSLKAGAIEVLDELDGLFELPAGHYNVILRALEQLDD